jgi:hypothetical protein
MDPIFLKAQSPLSLNIILEKKHQIRPSLQKFVSGKIVFWCFLEPILVPKL